MKAPSAGPGANAEANLPVFAAEVAAELGIPQAGVEGVLKLFAEGATVPFIARYRKEVTGSLDEVQIRAIEERNTYLRELFARKQSVLASIEEQGKLTDDLKKRILAADTKATVEDLYQPYKKKRRTRGEKAKEKGLLPLAERIMSQAMEGDVDEEAAAFVDAEKEVPDVMAALKGARDIIAEVLADNADARKLVRETFSEKAEAASEIVADKVDEKTKFDEYRDYSESVKTIPSHRFLAIRRGEKEGVLRTKLAVDLDTVHPELERIMGLQNGSPFAKQMSLAVAEGLRRLLKIQVETDLWVDLKMRADREAVGVFAENLKNLLLQAPLGARGVIGIDPGLRTGCKVAVVDGTGKFLENTTLFLTQGAGKKQAAEATLLALVHKHQPAAIAVGNGTGGRETEAFVRKLLKEMAAKSEGPMKKVFGDVLVVSVSESGASIYSASDIARDEFPDLDLTVRGAISIARRLQDPLAELVKVDPKSIGVGQYQHDVYQTLLSKKLDEVVESCVNKVGVEVNTASAPLLARVAGIGPSLAKKVVRHRDEKGKFASRDELKSVSGLGPAAFEQATGFLRIHGAENPLDNSAVHPERYGIVEQMAKDLGIDVASLVGDNAAVSRIDLKKYITDDVGEPTLRDIVDELKKPGRDPRDEFVAPKFRDDVNEMEDLKVGMELEGVVTNVTAFCAFVDVGVHQDGLVHISQLADRFVDNPHDVVKSGQKLKVKVLEIDLDRRRIALTARLGESVGTGGGYGSAEFAAGNRKGGGGGGGGGRGKGGGGYGGGRNAGGRSGGGGGARRGGGRHGGGGRSGGQGGGRGGSNGGNGGGGFSNNPFQDLLKK